MDETWVSGLVCVPALLGIWSSQESPRKGFGLSHNRREGPGGCCLMPRVVCPLSHLCFSGPSLLCNRVVVVVTIIRIASISATQSAVCALAASASPGSLLGTQVPWLRPDVPKWSLWAWGAAICFNSLAGESEDR